MWCSEGRSDWCSEESCGCSDEGEMGTGGVLFGDSPSEGGGGGGGGGSGFDVAACVVLGGDGGGGGGADAANVWFEGPGSFGCGDMIIDVDVPWCIGGSPIDGPLP